MNRPDPAVSAPAPECISGLLQYEAFLCLPNTLLPKSFDSLICTLNLQSAQRSSCRFFEISDSLPHAVAMQEQMQMVGHLCPSTYINLGSFSVSLFSYTLIFICTKRSTIKIFFLVLMT